MKRLTKGWREGSGPIVGPGARCPETLFTMPPWSEGSCLVSQLKSGSRSQGSAPRRVLPERRVRGIPTEPGVPGAALPWPRLGSHTKPGATSRWQHLSDRQGKHWACSETGEPSVRKEKPPKGLTKLSTESHLANPDSTFCLEAGRAG